MRKFVDARGVDCPKPVTLTKEAFDDPKMTFVEVKLDSQVALENVKRFIGKYGGKIDEMLKNGDEVTIIASRTSEPKADSKSVSKNSEIYSDISYVIATSEIGKGDAELGKKLMSAFLSTLAEYKTLPSTIFFMNHGVLLCVQDSPSLESLKKLEEKGVEIIVCGTCTDYLKVTDNVSVGILGNMYDLVELYGNSSKVISL